MASNTELEMRWAQAWSDLYEIARDRQDLPCQLPDGWVIGMDDCLGWLQDSVYAGYLVRVEEGWVGHLRGALVHRRHPVA